MTETTANTAAPDLPDLLERQRARVRELQNLYGEQVRGPMTTDNALWEALKEAETILRMMELSYYADRDR